MVLCDSCTLCVGVILLWFCVCVNLFNVVMINSAVSHLQGLRIVSLVMLNGCQILVIYRYVTGMLRSEKLQGKVVQVNHSESTCPVCLEDIETVAFKTPCNHLFHKKCLNQCFQYKHTQCPVCRESMV